MNSNITNDNDITNDNFMKNLNAKVESSHFQVGFVAGFLLCALIAITLYMIGL